MNQKAFVKYLATGEYVQTMDAGIADLDAIKGSLEAHDRRFHPNGYKEGDHCDFRDRLAKGDFADASLAGLMEAAGKDDTSLKVSDSMVRDAIEKTKHLFRNFGGELYLYELAEDAVKEYLNGKWYMPDDTFEAYKKALGLEHPVLKAIMVAAKKSPVYSSYQTPNWLQAEKSKDRIKDMVDRGGKTFFKSPDDALKKLQYYATDYKGWFFDPETEEDLIKKASATEAEEVLKDRVAKAAAKVDFRKMSGFDSGLFYDESGIKSPARFNGSYNGGGNIIVEANARAMGNEITDYKKSICGKVGDILKRYARAVAKEMGMSGTEKVKVDSALYMNAPSVTGWLNLNEPYIALKKQIADEFRAAKAILGKGIKSKTEVAAERKTADQKRIEEYERTLPADKKELPRKEGVQTFEAIEKAIADAKAAGKPLQARFEVNDYEDADEDYYYGQKNLVSRLGGKVTSEDSPEYSDDGYDYGYARGFTATIPPDVAHKLYMAITVNDGYHGAMTVPTVAK